MRVGAIAVAFVVFGGVACRPSAPPPRPAAVELAKQAVDKSKIEPLYRGTKAIEAAAVIGVSYEKMNDLLQAAATELSIVRDKPLSADEERIVLAFGEALKSYKDSLVLWHGKIAASNDQWKGEIPIAFSTPATDSGEILAVVEKYQLPVAERRVPYTGAKYKSVPGSSPQVVWKAASAHVADGVRLMNQP